MNEVLVGEYGNASSQHRKGCAAKAILEESRSVLAEALNVQPDEIYFTSGGTESNNLAITGVCMAAESLCGRIVTSTLEHPSVTKTIRSLKRQGRDVDYIEARHGDLDMKALECSVRCDVALISIMSVQNELGYIFPVEDVVQLRNSLSPNTIIHTDAVQAFGKMPVLSTAKGVDLASISAHKIGGPKGIGALFVRRGTSLFTTACGGGQERGLRSGTEPVYLAAGFAEAVRVTFSTLSDTIKHVAALNHYIITRLHTELPGTIINSRDDGSPFIISVSFPGIDNRELLAALNAEGIYLSKASACEANRETVTPGTWRKKHPLALQQAGISLKQGRSTVRISLCPANTKSEVDIFIDKLQAFFQKHPA
jgi:cysteine desulfurase